MGRYSSLLLGLITSITYGCQSNVVSTIPPENQGDPSPTPTVASSGEPQQGAEFSLSVQEICSGESVTISLNRSNLNRGKIPISLQNSLPAETDEVAIPGGSKQPAIPIENTVFLGEMDVSPLGLGSFTFTLKTEYVTRNGQKFVIEPGQRYLLYWEPRPGALSFIGELKVCP